MLFALLTTAALAFEPSVNSEGLMLQWAEMPVYYSIDTTQAPAELPRGAQVDAVRAGMEAWSGVDAADVVLVEGTPDTRDRQEEAGEVYWLEEWPFDDQALALTSTWSTPGGTILSFEIAVNASEDTPWNLDGSDEAWDLQNAITHEVGHVLGLAHNGGDPEVTMYPTAPRGEILKRDLHWDDQEGARFMYPEVTGGEGFDLSQLACSTSGGSAPWAAALLPLLALLRRRTRP